ncbi:MAG: peptidoglycan DD-metalloendopeptidase family protein [Chitinophagaceae bacterium]
MLLFKRVSIILSIMCFTMAHSYAQQPSKEELNKQKVQIEKEIADLNKSLREVSNNKKEALKILTLINAKVEARESLIRNINKDIKRIDEDLFVKERDIYRLKRELDTLKIKYAKSLVFAYKNRSNYQYLNFLFSANDFNDALKRVTYLKSYRSLRETEAANIAKTQQLLQSTITQLGDNKNEKQTALLTQNEQLKKAEEDKKEKDRILQDLKGQEKDLQAQIKKRERQRQELNNAINAAIRREIAEAQKKEKERMARLKAEQEQKRRELEAIANAKKEEARLARLESDKKNKEAKDAKERELADAKAKEKEKEALKAKEKVNAITYGPGSVLNPGGQVTLADGKKREYSVFETTKEGLEISMDFEKNRGRLPWPVSSGDVCAKFGITKVTVNLTEKHDGIIVCLPIGSQVKGVANGEVMFVQNLDEYKSVAVRHGKYLTVYSRLSEVNVVKGQKISAGTAIGKAAQSDRGGGEIEFRVMNGENNQFLNPENWLIRR